MTRSHNWCCHGKARILSPLTVVGLYLDVSDMKVLNFAMEVRQRLHFALLSSHQIFYTDFNTFRKRVKNVVTSKGIEVWIECK
jgi:hypothetical protein